MKLFYEPSRFVSCTIWDMEHETCIVFTTFRIFDLFSVFFSIFIFCASERKFFQFNYFPSQSIFNVKKWKFFPLFLLYPFVQRKMWLCSASADLLQFTLRCQARCNFVCTLNLLTNILCSCYLCPTNLNFLVIFYCCYRLDDATMGTNVSIKHLSDAMIESRSHRKKNGDATHIKFQQNPHLICATSQNEEFHVETTTANHSTQKKPFAKFMTMMMFLCARKKCHSLKLKFLLESRKEAKS